MAKKMTDEEKVLVVARRIVKNAKKLRAEIAAHPEVYNSEEIVEGLPGEPTMTEVVEGLLEVFESWSKLDVETVAARLRQFEERRRRSGEA